MLKIKLLAVLIFCSCILFAQEKRIIVIMAHPDDCELTTGGTAILLSKMGYKVKYVSLTNGNAGHHMGTKNELAVRRYLETQEVAKRLPCDYEVINNDDGKLIASLENRLEVIRLIREWKADIVITHPPYDYHPDHRNTSTLVQDAAFMVKVPKIVPDVPALRQNPLFLYAKGRYNKAETDIIVDISSVTKEKAYVLDSHVSQFYEWLPWVDNSTTPIPETKEGRLKYMEERYVLRRGALRDTDKIALEKWYGAQHVQMVKAAEAFEICQFGRSVTDQDIRELFPMFNK